MCTTAREGGSAEAVGTSKAVAELVEKDLQLKIARGQYLGIFDTNGTPFSEYAKEWLERKKMNVSQSTWRDYKSTLEVHAIPHFGGMPLNQIRRRDIEEFLDKLGALSAKRKNNVMVPVKNIFNDAMRREDLRDNPCQLIRRFKEEKPQIDPFSFPEMKAFLDAVEPHYVAYFTTAFLIRDAAQRDAGAEVAPRGLRHALHHDPGGTRPGDRGPAQDALLLPGRRHARAAPPGPSAAPGRLPARRRVRLPEPARQPAGGRQPAQQGLVPGAEESVSLECARCTRPGTRSPLMLSHGEDPLWIARMLGHTTLQMVFQHYGKFIRNRARKDGGRFTQGMTEAGLFKSVPKLPEGPTVYTNPEETANGSPRGLTNIRNHFDGGGIWAHFGHKRTKSAKKRGHGFP